MSEEEKKQNSNRFSKTRNRLRRRRENLFRFSKMV